MRSVRLRLTLFTMLMVAAILASMGLLLRYRVQANIIGEIDRQLLADVSSVSTGKPQADFESGSSATSAKPTSNPPLGSIKQLELDGSAPATLNRVASNSLRSQTLGIRPETLNRVKSNSLGSQTLGEVRNTSPTPERVASHFPARASASIPNAHGPKGRPLSNAIPTPGSTNMIEVVRANSSEARLIAVWSAPKLVPVINGRIPENVHPVADSYGAQYAATHSILYHDFLRSGVPMRSLSKPISDAGKVFAVVQSTRPIGPVQAQMADLDRGLLMSIPVAILMAAIGGAFLIGGAMRPLRKLTASARHLEANLSGERLPAEGRDEFAELASAFNEALDRTSAAFASQTRAMAQLERFTGDAGHELRTPLASVKGSTSYLLHMTSLPPESIASVQIIDRSADRMARLIGDLLLLARQDSGHPQFRSSKINLDSLIRECLEILRIPEAIEVQTRVPPGLDITIDADALARVVTNLTSNALAYARSQVSINATAEDGFLHLTVSDDGEGVAPEHLSRLGERFYRPDESRSRDRGGAGLGLAIVKSLCESHGGSLTITSQQGIGTTAVARFPQQPE